MEKVTSNDIKIALANSHEGKSFFTTECKTGPTYGNTHLYKFDGLAIAKSWAHPCITGYEIKVSRGDFLQDNKYCCYLPYCNEMYFVVPKGLIDKTEIPTEFGLIYYHPDSKVLQTKKKAIFRNIDISGDLLMYIIMNKLDSDRYPFHSTKDAFFKEWLDNKRHNRELGYQIRSRMAKLIEEYEDRLERVSSQENAINQLYEIDQYLSDVHQKYVWRKENRLEIIKELLEKPFPKDIENIKKKTEEILKIFEKLEIETES